MDRPTQAASQITELKVSGHTMALEPGLYCVFNAPGSPAASDSGLPGVRITAAPGRASGRVSVAGFSPDGWIGVDAGVLVRVLEGAADVLVTVYQAPGSKAEAPKLQVVRLSGEGAVAQPAPSVAARPRPAPDTVEVVAHIYARGDIGGLLGDWMGEPGSQRWIEGFGISPLKGLPHSDVEYQAVLGRGWLSPWSEGGQFCGSRGMSLPILGLRVRLRGESATTHRVVLSATFVDGTRIGPVGAGEACEAPSLAALEAFQVAFEPIEAKRGRAPAAPVPAPAKPKRGLAKQAAKPAAPPAAPPLQEAPKAKASAPKRASPKRGT